MNTPEEYDVLVLGSGTAGKPWPARWPRKEGEPPSSSGSTSPDPVPMWHACPARTSFTHVFEDDPGRTIGSEGGPNCIARLDRK
jgi:hypothetical protein